MACILLWSSAVRVHDSQAYRKMDMTRERISRILELREILRVWHAALWATMKKYNISTNLIQVIRNLYNKATSAVLFNDSIGDWFRTTVSQHSDGNDVSSVSIESERGLSHLPVCLRVMDSQSRAPKKNTSYGNRVLPQDTTRLIQRPCYQ